LKQICRHPSSTFASDNHQNLKKMKILQTKQLLVLIIALLTINAANAQKYKKYYQKSGKLVQNITGNSKGTCTTYWDDYGYKEVKIENTVTKMFGITSEDKKTTLMIGSKLYTWSKNDDKVTKMTNDIAQTWEQKNYSAEQVGAMSEATLKQLGYKKTGTEVLLGKTCDVWEGIGKSWAWKNLNLKAVVKMMGVSITYEPVLLDVESNVPSSVFELPEGKKIVNAEDQIPDDGSEDSKNAKKMMKSLFGND
jgi:hypothetical protein